MSNALNSAGSVPRVRNETSITKSSLVSGMAVKDSTSTFYVNVGYTGGATPLLGQDTAEIVTTTNTITASENGKTFYLSLAAGFVSTLPAPALGLRYRFIVRTAPSAGSYTIVTNSSANIMKGHVLSSDLNAAADGDFETAGGDTFTFVTAKAVAGDWADFESDGTSWFVRASNTVFDASTITTAS